MIAIRKLITQRERMDVQIMVTTVGWLELAELYKGFCVHINFHFFGINDQVYNNWGIW